MKQFNKNGNKIISRGRFFGEDSKMLKPALYKGDPAAQWRRINWNEILTWNLASKVSWNLQVETDFPKKLDLQTTVKTTASIHSAPQINRLKWAAWNPWKPLETNRFQQSDQNDKKLKIALRGLKIARLQSRPKLR